MFYSGWLISTLALGVGALSSTSAMTQTLEPPFFGKDPRQGEVVIPKAIDPNYKHIGYLKFTRIEDGQKHWCTAQFVLPRVLLTAAHCIDEFGNGRLNTDYQFYQINYYGDPITISEGTAPACHKYPDKWTLSAETTYFRMRFDYAFILLDTDSKAGTGDILPISDQLTNKEVFTLGYEKDANSLPTAPNSNSVGRDHPNDHLFQHLYSFKPALALNEDYWRGQSGGAWIVDTPSPTVVSVTAWYASSFGGNEPRLYGPMFDAETQSTLNYVAAGCQ
ncbi:trypsin-like serine protease [Allomesorhizobium camelthorni]|uniref:Trypsin-like serine protease n=1 Tax=Allomesorhizobium camelthorni TaxID=475069 RepID=A0A6G4WNY5_9HYPH|nr:trypsin-like serine protease [Mesorhizobium camelthorni]NGO55777.1 trypsin-like serine protease [Mesorhizobium camelthorni]